MPNDPDHAQAPPSGEHTNLPADASVWVAARRSYVEDGLSCPVVAERHGLHRRTVSRHAHDEDWAGQRARHAAAACRQSEAARAEAELDDPAVALVADLRASDDVDLLVNPSSAVLIRNATRRVGEAMQAGRVVEARGWGRLLADLRGAAPEIDDAMRGGASDRLRADFYRGVHASLVRGGDEPEEGRGPQGAPAVA